MRYEEIVPPPPHRLERGHIVKVEGDRGGAEFRAAHQLPIDLYLSRGIITPAQHRAGRRYEFLWVTSKHVHHHVQVTYAEFGNAASDPEARFLIGPEFVEAMKAVRGLIPRKVLDKVCLRHRPAGPTNLCYLRAALDDLAAHFKASDGNAR